MAFIDVTKIEPRLKHPTIFEQFDALKGGDTLVIHNDHDPKPLYYQMVAERGQVFDWEYLQEGPETWEVRITRLRSGEQPATIGELVAADYRKAEVFRKFGLDFCCGGKKSVEQACREKGLDVHALKKELADLDNQGGEKGQDFDQWALDTLADYIVDTHHRYVNESTPILYELTQKVARVHGDRHPELIDIADHFDAVAQELRMHMHKEERILFPYIKAMAEAEREGRPLPRAPFGPVQNPIRMMEAEHESAGGDMAAIQTLSGNYTPPADACTSYRVLFAKLQEFEQDLHQHIHLENNILFPKAVALESAPQPA
ncbi:MAG: iron-sulfur cluster repair di-iron protein [Thermoanaerobaculia bacterium]|nr:iron-sulfur cluster repair di-iron protein [Thermoanaerobaculia bacterium]